MKMGYKCSHVSVLQHNGRIPVNIPVSIVPVLVGEDLIWVICVAYRVLACNRESRRVGVSMPQHLLALACSYPMHVEAFPMLLC